MSDEDPTRRERIRKHLKENRTKYIVGTTGVSCLVIGTVTGMQFRNPPEMLQIVKPKQVIGVAYKSPITMNTITLLAKGDPGDVVERVGTDLRWASKGDLARDLGVARSMVTRYFNGTVPDLLDEQYEVIGKAGHAIPV